MRRTLTWETVPLGCLLAHRDPDVQSVQSGACTLSGRSAGKGRGRQDAEMDLGRYMNANIRLTFLLVASTNAVPNTFGEHTWMAVMHCLTTLAHTSLLAGTNKLCAYPWELPQQAA
jgi:hypothetical protein